MELLSGTDLGTSISDVLVAEPIIVYTSFVNVAETEYVLCRRFGRAYGRGRMETLISSGRLSIRDDISLHTASAKLKCERAMSLPDCYTLAVAEVTSSTPVFLFREKDLVREMERKPFDIEPFFLT